MKHVGILAHSAEGAALCFRAFCQEGFRELGPHQHPDVTLDCIALAQSMEAWDRGNHHFIRDLLAKSIGRLAQAGADFFICPDNTAHIALEEPGDELPLPGLHIAEEVAGRAALSGYVRVGILGTSYTMRSQLYPRAFAARGIAAEIPEPAKHCIIDQIIFEELVNGILSDSARREYGAIIGGFRDRGSDAVALVCTEIPLLVTPEASPLPTLDSTRLLARAAFEGLFKSVDSGGTWARIALTSLRVNVLRLAGTDSSTLIAGLEQGGIYRSDDGGQIWRSSSTGLPTGIVWDLIFNPSDPAQLFVSIDGSGVFQSRDGGTSWESFSDGLADPQITRLTFDETGSYLLAGGASLGVWSHAVPVSRELLERIPIRSEPRLVKRR